MADDLNCKQYVWVLTDPREVMHGVYRTPTAALKALVKAHPSVKYCIGHPLDGDDRPMFDVFMVLEDNVHKGLVLTAWEVGT